MKKEKAIMLAYSAGLFDGEGCVRIATRNPRNGRSLYHHLHVTITQKDGQIIDWLYGNFGGIVYLKNKIEKNWIYEWKVTDKKAYEFLKKILPYLIYKKDQAKLAITMQERIDVGRDRFGRWNPKTEHEINQREQIRLALKESKKQFVKSKNPNVREYNYSSMVQPQRLSDMASKEDAIV